MYYPAHPEVTLAVICVLTAGKPLAHVAANMRGAVEKTDKLSRRFLHLQLQWHKKKHSISNLILKKRGAPCDLISNAPGCWGAEDPTP